MTSRRDLQFRRRRFVLAVIGTALVLSLTVLISGLQASFSDEVDRTLESLGGDGYVVREGAAGPFTAISQLDEGQVDAVGSAPGVREAIPLVTIRESVGSDNPTDVYLVGYEPGGSLAPEVAKGRPVGSSGEVVVNSSLGADVGDEIEVGGRAFDVLGQVDGLSVFAGIPVGFVSVDDVRETVFAGLDVATSVLVSGVPESLPESLDFVSTEGARDDLLRSLESAVGSIDLSASHTRAHHGFGEGRDAHAPKPQKRPANASTVRS